MLEMGTRLGGNGVAELLGLVNGVDVTEASVLMAIGEPVDLAPCAARFAGSRVLTADVAGTLLGWSGVDQAAGLPEVARPDHHRDAGRAGRAVHALPGEAGADPGGCRRARPADGCPDQGDRTCPSGDCPTCQLRR